ncbi:hypothetical protein [Neobacillus kokaensis]|uniref:Uncharacterized protein n=1 Tax=Neobacillus kokaensis TaxID=2759023 RepID=A0ABQ3NCL9_9BACI|nr:hypothetical protein [Neobacillus kokaensis]GHI01660.1 hypothetical protein AM1BK_52020 [Neobacillus kokaensis]
MLKKLSGLAISALIVLGCLFPFNTASAATVSLDQLAENVKYHTESRIAGYQDVEKTGYKEVEKTGYQDVEVPVYDYVQYDFRGKDSNGYYCFDRSGFGKCYSDQYTYDSSIQSGELKIEEKSRDVTKYRTETYTVKQPYTVKEPVYKTVTSYSAKQSVQAYTSKSVKRKLSGINPYGKKFYVKMPKSTKLSRVNKDWYVGKFTYKTYYKDERYYTHAKISTGIYYYNSKGKRVRVTIPRNTTLTVSKGKYYATVTYTPYKKVKGKWQRQKPIKKKVSVYRGSVSYAMSYEPINKTKSAYIQAKYVQTKTAKVKTGVKTITKYKSVTKTKQVPYTVTKQYKEYYIYEQVGSKTEQQPYTYTESEPYTYTVQEPIYENVQVENTLQQKYQNIVNYYWTYRLTEEEMGQLFTMVGVPYSVADGYDLSRYVSGVVTVNGVSTYYSFTPSKKVKLIVFDDNTAINLSYLTTVYGNNYNDVKINFGSYRVE